MEIGAVVLVAIGVIVAGIGLTLVPRPVETTTVGGTVHPSRAGIAVTACGAIAIVCALVGLILRVAD